MINLIKKLPTLTQRIFIATTFAAAGLSFLVYSLNQLFIVFIASVFCIIFFEYAYVLTKKKISSLFVLLVLFAGLRLMNFFLKACCQVESFYDWFNNQALIAILLLVLVSFFRKGKMQFLFWFILAVVWLILPLLILVNLSFFAEAKKLIVFLVLLIITNDTAAYLAGKKWGKKKLAPTISPNKTYLGSVAGLLATTLMAIAIHFIWQLFEFWQALIFAIVLGIAAQLGDLLESKFKRFLKIKDTGSILLAHGGMLDRSDAFLVCLPVYYYLLYFFGFR